MNILHMLNSKHLVVLNAYLLGEATEELIKKLGKDEAHILGKETQKEIKMYRFLLQPQEEGKEKKEEKKNMIHYEV